MRTTTSVLATLLTPAEAAERLSVCLKTIYNLIGTRKLEHIRIGRAIRIHPDSIVDYIEASTMKVQRIDEMLRSNENYSAERS